MPPRLQGPKLIYKRLIKSAVVGALRSVFTQEYGDDPMFRNLRVTQDYSLREITFPTIVVNYRGNETTNLGVGHQEIWLTERGYERHMRRWFDGSIHFDIYATSPEDRDALYDALTDILAFGRLELMLDNFFQYLEFHDFGVVYQIMLNDGVHHDEGDSTSKPWWGPEDVLLFRGGMSLDIKGTFASVVEDAEQSLAFINKIIVYPYIFGYEDTPDPEPLWVEWQGTSNSEDNAYVSGEGVVSSLEVYTPSP